MLLVHSWPKAGNWDFPAGKEIRDGQGISIVECCSLKNGFSALRIFTQPTRAVNSHSMSIRINEQADLDTLI